MVAVGGAVALAVSSAPPSLAGQLTLLAIGSAVIGLPHGAVDHDVAARARSLTGVPFYVAYLGLVLVVGLTWWLAPQVAFLGFLAASAWHFGEGDLRHLAPVRTLGRVTRGLLVVGVLFSAQPDAVATLLGPSLAGLMPPAAWSGPIAASLLSLHIAVLLATPGIPFGRRSRAVADAVVVTLWLWCAPPILAFTGYFCLWHSLAHVRTLTREGIVQQLFPRALPLTLAASIGLVVGLQVLFRTVPEGAVASALLPAIAALAMPHMVLVELWRHRAASGLLVESAPGSGGTAGTWVGTD